MSTIEKQHHRGTYHFSPKENWMNDPNGMVYFQGEYHLFFQHHPYGTTWGPMHWGHAVSKDLVVWEELPIALGPDEHGMIFSGSAVVDWNNTTGFFDGEPGLVAIFTHHAEAADNKPAVQCQSLAYSRDNGRTWVKYEHNPVLRHESYVDFRDPKVFWHEPSQLWVMVLACGQTVCLYRSPDLKSWTFASEFGKDVGFHNGVWECPDLFPLQVDGSDSGTKWVLLVSIGDDPAFAEGSRTQYFTGDFDGERFKPDRVSRETIRWLDSGRDNYAGVSWSDIPAEDGRRLFIGWMSNWKYANLTPTAGWRGAMTIPREIGLQLRNNETWLTQQPARELLAYRRPRINNSRITAKAAAAVLEDLQLSNYEIRVVLDAANSLDIHVRVGSKEKTVIGYNGSASEVFIDRTQSGVTDFHPDFPGRHTAMIPEQEGTLELRIFVDQASVEVFAGGGQAVLTDLIYPAPASTGLTVFAADDRMIIDSLEVYELSV